MPVPSDTSKTLQVLAAAVTPVVLVSATAILIAGVNSRYIAIADRMRMLAREYRDELCPIARRAVITEEIQTFRKRIVLVAWAVRVLYTAVGCFITDVVIISATAWRSALESATLPFFVLGITLILISIALELIELHISARTIRTEIRDIPSSP
jgi:hypothetical protein